MNVDYHKMENLNRLFYYKKVCEGRIENPVENPDFLYVRRIYINHLKEIDELIEFEQKIELEKQKIRYNEYISNLGRNI